MSPSEFISPAFEEWEFSNPEKDRYRWKREDVVADDEFYDSRDAHSDW
jgi:hypothetical protein